MRRATADRGEIVHVAGLHGLSPALRDGAPVLSSGHGDAARCGWEAFFAAMEERGLALAWDPEDPAAAALVPRSELPLHGHVSQGGLARTARFVRALLGRSGPQ
ncbi:MAG TPA: hypothetical protein VFR85_09345 [Anaeromyxobacteraceae bacterium]|nr:hypothetical protein [Anaeromyxobacteraceae bacterium]